MDNRNIGDELRKHVTEILGEEAFAKILLVAFSEAAMASLSKSDLDRVSILSAKIFVKLARTEIAKAKAEITKSNGGSH